LMKFRNVLKTLSAPVTQAPDSVCPAKLKASESKGLRKNGSPSA
jgi:hypothetical protein